MAIKMSKNDQETDGYICKECGEYYTMKVNASNHAKRTNHLDFERGFIDGETKEKEK